MPSKIHKVVLCGSRGCGKSALLEQLVYGTHRAGQPMFPTIEDTYAAEIEAERGIKECFRFYDTAGLHDQQQFIPEYWCSVADAFILVYSITERESFSRMEKVKADIDRLKEKRDMIIVAVGSKADLESERQVDPYMAQAWGQREKVRVFEATVRDRRTLIEPIQYLATKLSPPQNKSSLLSRKRLSNLNDGT